MRDKAPIDPRIADSAIHHDSHDGGHLLPNKVVEREETGADNESILSEILDIFEKILMDALTRSRRLGLIFLQKMMSYRQ